MVVTATPPAATATGPVTAATRRGAAPDAAAPLGDRRAVARMPRRVRASRSATVVAAIAPSAVPTSALPQRPFPGVIGPSTLAATYGAARLSVPIARLVTVSRRS